MTPAPQPTARGDPDALDRALDRAVGGRRIPGNAIRLLTDGPEVFGAAIGLIERATRWIHFENYIIRADGTGEIFAKHLGAAARRGVRVRVLYDAFGCRGTPRRFWAALRQAGVDVRAFRSINPLHPVRSLQRDHRKLVSVDGSAAVIGGVCIGDEWAGDPERDRAPWRDTAIEVEGPAVAALEQTFARLWRDARGTDALRTVPRPDAVGGAAVRIVDGLPRQLRLYRALELLMAAAAQRIWISDAYFMAPTPVYAALIAAARDGVDVRLLVPGKTDLPWIRTLARVGYRELLDAGVRIWEWHRTTLHAKTVLVDDRWFKAGSSNLNPSSLLSNHELDVLVDDEALAAAAQHQFRRDLARAVEVVIRARRAAVPLVRRLPAAVVAVEPIVTAPRHPRDVSRRAVMTVWQVAGGARRSVAGAVLFVAVGVGALLVAVPRVMAYSLAALCLWLAAGAAGQFFRRRRYRDG